MTIPFIFYGPNSGPFKSLHHEDRSYSKGPKPGTREGDQNWAPPTDFRLAVKTTIWTKSCTIYPQTPLLNPIIPIFLKVLTRPPNINPPAKPKHRSNEVSTCIHHSLASRQLCSRGPIEKKAQQLTLCSPSSTSPSYRTVHSSNHLGRVWITISAANHDNSLTSNMVSSFTELESWSEAGSSGRGHRPGS